MNRVVRYGSETMGHSVPPFTGNRTAVRTDEMVRYDIANNKTKTAAYAKKTEVRLQDQKYEEGMRVVPSFRICSFSRGSL